ncbi:hypothetical protein DYI24_00375 [Rhodopseudomonas sp. BR0C11]|uniref:hypothetical protein n=1 Tax=Rhodopseudomonas sp. BR0C11 TaxID=2269370 RepID=UPI0013DEDE47|nr:hypothetical protein [Rhodopseudomonas sp. BR0C11]NEV75536.1 hypothetical protein [Rhodopseudomonas sp. BR0C11]
MSLEDVAREYFEKFGEAEYRYDKRHVTWTKFRREPGYHCSPTGPGTEVSKEEYDANIAQSDRCRSEAFMGRFQQSYWLYGRTMSKPGWRERLIDDVKSLSLLQQQSD